RGLDSCCHARLQRRMDSKPSSLGAVIAALALAATAPGGCQRSPETGSEAAAGSAAPPAAPAPARGAAAAVTDGGATGQPLPTADEELREEIERLRRS